MPANDGIPDLSGFTGRRVVLIAGGTSVTASVVREIALARLSLGSEIRVVAINDAVFLAWWADWLHFSDLKWWNWHGQRISGFSGLKTTIDPLVPAVAAYRFENSGKFGFDENPANCRTGGNSAYQAMHICCHARVSEIVLVGVDMDLRSHWFGDHPDTITSNRIQAMLPAFETLKPALKERGIKVYNASPISNLKVWPRVDLHEYLSR